MAKFDSKRYDRYLYQEVKVITKDGRIIECEVVSGDWMTYKEPTIYMEYNDEYEADRLEAVSESDIEDIKITKKHPNPFFRNEV